MQGKIAFGLCSFSLVLLWATWPLSQKPDDKSRPLTPPHGQDQMPGPPLSPSEALAKMKVPEGFSVELVLAEPDLVNPVAMCFDERGRLWVTESLEYPRHDAGPGRDRIKVFESTKGNGRYDKVTLFAEGLNIPSGIAVGHGGVWVVNSPDLLFYKEGPDGKAAGKPEVVLTGFGRDDTHELPNSLTWGPDGWLYGLNGVFNRSVVKHQGKTFDFTCALFRLHPVTREFQLFCEGTSNPWGIAIDGEGSFFVSACVIDHLWHLTETGYYHRQGGPYPPFTWKIESIVPGLRHQKAAYCGIVWFDSDAFPKEYRDVLYMGNIHGSCLNTDALTRLGSTYQGVNRADFLTANDAWFMPVAQKIGPDGCLYVLDWYDQYHCYQDANRDPNGIDRERGRLYRIRHKDSPPSGKFDLTKENDDELIKRLGSGNVFQRETAQRVLIERNRFRNSLMLPERLEKLALDSDAPRKQRLHALWARISMAPVDSGFLGQLLALPDATFRAWAVRAAGNQGKLDEAGHQRIAAVIDDSSRDVLLQLAIASRKIEGLDALAILVNVLNRSGDDQLIPHIVWQNLHPLLENQGEAFARMVEKSDPKKSGNLVALMPRVIHRLLVRPKMDAPLISQLVRFVIDSREDIKIRETLSGLSQRVQTGEISSDKATLLHDSLKPLMQKILADYNAESNPALPLVFEANLLEATFKDPAALAEMRRAVVLNKYLVPLRQRALETLVFVRDPKILDIVEDALAQDKMAEPLHGPILAVLGQLEDPRVAEIVLRAYPKMSPARQTAALDLLTQRGVWGKQLLNAIGDKQIPASALGANQIRKLLASKDKEIAKLVTEKWGTLRTERNPAREQVVKEMRDLLMKTPGDADKGKTIFQNTCAKCHKIYGEGQDVGPDITSNGRATFDQLLSNVFDPSLVIGASYQATTVTDTKGRVMTGLIVEQGPAGVVLKMEGGKLETIPKANIEEISVSKVSLMPEGLEKQLKPQEIADLFAFLCLDRQPDKKGARKIPGAP